MKNSSFRGRRSVVSWVVWLSIVGVGLVGIVVVQLIHGARTRVPDLLEALARTGVDACTSVAPAAAAVSEMTCHASTFDPAAKIVVVEYGSPRAATKQAEQLAALLRGLGREPRLVVYDRWLCNATAVPQWSVRALEAMQGSTLYQ